VRFLFRPLTGAAQAIVLALVVIALITSNVVYTNHVNAESVERHARQSEQVARAWCALIVPLDERYRARPPQTPEDQRVANTIRDLRIVYRCQ
jgi:hypothetical protein